jgi:hypothetical protein
MAKVFNVSGADVCFDDFEEDAEDQHEWSQVCESCRIKYNIPASMLDENSGSGICGVQGCLNDSDHYIDF